MAKKNAECEIETEVILIDETYIKNRIYMVRGQKVMLDYELAEIYGYTTTRFNEQVKNSIEKFDDDFMFQLTKEEFGILMSQGLISKNSTSNRGGLRASVFSDFCKEYPYLKIQMIQTCGKFHDRYIILDYEQESEKIYLCGASSKDAGTRITSITEFMSKTLLKPVVDALLKNPALVLK